MRPSTFGGRASHAVNSQANAAAAKAQLIEKKKEFDAVRALERVSAGYLERIEGLAGDFDVMADAGQACGQVLSQWPEMFRILNMFLATRDKTVIEEGLASTPDDGQRIVRVPVEDLQQLSTTTNQ